MSFSTTSHLENPSIRLSDSIVGRVLPRVHVGRHHARIAGATIPTLPTPIKADATMVSPFVARALGYKLHNIDAATGGAVPRPVPSSYNATNTMSPGTTRATGKRKMSAYYSSALRRQQCRANQARYRDRQRNARTQLEKSVEQLQQEVGSLKRKYRDLSSRKRSNQSPWRVVAEVFSLFESSFKSPWRMATAQDIKTEAETRQILAILERSFTHDAAMGNLVGVDALLEQLQYFSQYFGKPHLNLQRIEAVAPGVMAANSTLSVTVTVLALRYIFPHLMKHRYDDYDSEHQHGSLYQRLLGKRLEFGITMTFLLDTESCRVVRLETKIDLVMGLLQPLGNLIDVSSVLEHAHITSECIVTGGSDFGQH
ncbi:hypothetical protein F442_03260 [Phytophthora nicotianae P10297]|uniref:Bzip transcription factor n=1 Tax=Phytophthora nicotianae P10297 TaxID=1317064 RepID=W2ZZC1_PHYNI|nr:hypothetical protein F442_03260 [Phytophthora nicotianae P10297]